MASRARALTTARGRYTEPHRATTSAQPLPTAATACSAGGDSGARGFNSECGKFFLVQLTHLFIDQLFLRGLKEDAALFLHVATVLFE